MRFPFFRTLHKINLIAPNKKIMLSSKYIEITFIQELQYYVFVKKIVKYFKITLL